MQARIFWMLAGILLCGTLLAVAGTTGKIKGKIEDKETNETLVGANVSIVGTSQGASSNIDGEYVILNVPAGVYELEVKFIGYQSVRVSNVRVNADLTTEQIFLLSPLAEGVTMSEIVVQRERDIINKNQTNVIRIQTQEDIENLPIRGVGAAVALSPGVVSQDGKLYIRGGRTEEVGYYLDGASTRNVVGRDRTLGASADQLYGSEPNENLTTVIPEALEEFQVQAGGYTAQYGGANSGIVRATMRSGTPSFKASLLLETDNFTGQNEERLGGYSYGYSNYAGTLSGPLFSDNIRFFIAGENQFDRDWRQVFWEGFRFENLPDAQGAVDANGVPLDTVAVLEVLPGNTPGMMRNRYTGNGTITLDFNPLIFRVGGSFTGQEQRGSALTIPEVFNLARLPITTTSDFLGSVKLTHVVSPQVLYEVNLSYGDNRMKRADPDFGDDFMLYSDSLANAPYGYRFRNYTIGPGSSTDGAGYRLYGFPFDKYGHPQTNFEKRTQTRIGGSFDLTAQIDKVHEIKAGGSYDGYKLRRYIVASRGLLTWYRDNPDAARTPGSLRDDAVGTNGGVNNYGYDFYGNELEDGIDGPKTPKFYSGYVQDKIEYEDLVLNAGLRLDVFDTDDIQFIDDPTTPDVVEGPDNPSVDPLNFIYRETGIRKKDVFTALSPRLGFSFPVSDRTVFHVHYGKFLQAPALNQLYTGRRTQGVSFQGGNFIPNPVGYDLDPERTTQYEIGFTQQISDNSSFDITGYYKDIRGQIQVVRQTVTSQAVAAAYNTLANGDFATTKGVELSIRLRRINRFQAQVNYTFSDAKGTGSTSASGISSVENESLYPTVISPLDFNNAHRGTVNVDFRFGENDGGAVLERFGINMLFSFNSGHPFTLSDATAGQQGPEQGALVENDPRNSQPREAVNSSTTPWNFNIDLRLDKTVNFGSLTANFFVYVQNLLNTQNVQNVYRRSGNAYDDGFLSDPELSSAIVAGLGPQYVEMYRAINLANGTHYFSTTGNDLYGTPRQIRFGARFEL